MTRARKDVHVTLGTTIEELVERHPESVAFLMKHGIRCIQCGEPMWGTLRDAMTGKGIAPERQEELLDRLDAFVRQNTQD